MQRGGLGTLAAGFDSPRPDQYQRKAFDMTTNRDMRIEFEAFCKRRDLPTRRALSGYYDPSTARHWITWQMMFADDIEYAKQCRATLGEAIIDVMLYCDDDDVTATTDLMNCDPSTDEMAEHLLSLVQSCREQDVALDDVDNDFVLAARDKYASLLAAIRLSREMTRAKIPECWPVDG